VQRGVESDPEAARVTAEAGQLRLERSQEIGRFYGEFFFWVNLVGVLTQMFLVSRIFKWFGVRAALFALPLIAFGGYAAIALTGAMAVLRIAKTAENSIDYSLQNTIKQALFLPTSREAKYKAKAAIDTFFVRFGDTASAGIIFFGLHSLGLGPRTFALVNVGLVSIWILLNVGISREHKKLIPNDGSD
jgi:AAA family ATP:ADP antiporter